jgi:hypothetical protein
MAPFHTNQSIATIWIELVSLFELEFREHDPDEGRSKCGRERGRGSERNRKTRE